MAVVRDFLNIEGVMKMKELKLDLEYCHGINKFNYNFDLNNDYLIYAPNGSMKTSFSKTLREYKESVDSSDVYFLKEHQLEI